MWRAFDVVTAGTYLGILLGRADTAEAWVGPLAKWRERETDMVALGMPSVASATHYKVLLLPVLLCVAGMFCAPRELARNERRDAIGDGLSFRIWRSHVQRSSRSARGTPRRSGDDSAHCWAAAPRR